MAGTRPPLYAIADLHGDLSQAKGALQLAGVIDPVKGEGVWIGGKAQVIQLGDLVDRGPNSLDCVRLFEEIKVPPTSDSLTHEQTHPGCYFAAISLHK